MKNLKKYIGAIGLGVFALGLMLVGGSAHAATDVVLAGAIASSTAFMTDNLTVILNFIISNVMLLIGAGLGVLAVYWVGRKIKTLFKK